MCTRMRSSIYGDITNVDTTGASKVTSMQDKLTCVGVEASHTMMKTDLQRVNRYKTMIFEVAHANQIDPAIIGAIMSRECRGGNTLENGWGDFGNAYGLMQVDKNYHTIVGHWDSKEHLAQGTEILTDMIKAIKMKFPNWTKEQQLKGGISAYNAGPGKVHSYDGVDSGTTGQDYANDVVARAQALKTMGY